MVRMIKYLDGKEMKYKFSFWPEEEKPMEEKPEPQQYDDPKKYYDSLSYMEGKTHGIFYSKEVKDHWRFFYLNKVPSLSNDSSYRQEEILEIIRSKVEMIDFDKVNQVVYKPQEIRLEIAVDSFDYTEYGEKTGHRFVGDSRLGLFCDCLVDRIRQCEEILENFGIVLCAVGSTDLSPEEVKIYIDYYLEENIGFPNILDRESLDKYLSIMGSRIFNKPIKNAVEMVRSLFGIDSNIEDSMDEIINALANYKNEDGEKAATYSFQESLPLPNYPVEFLNGSNSPHIAEMFGGDCVNPIENKQEVQDFIRQDKKIKDLLKALERSNSDGKKQSEIQKRSRKKESRTNNNKDRRINSTKGVRGISKRKPNKNNIKRSKR